jgi:hypothetical protein
VLREVIYNVIVCQVFCWFVIEYVGGAIVFGIQIVAKLTTIIAGETLKLTATGQLPRVPGEQKYDARRRA